MKVMQLSEEARNKFYYDIIKTIAHANIQDLEVYLRNHTISQNNLKHALEYTKEHHNNLYKVAMLTINHINNPEAFVEEKVRLVNNIRNNPSYDVIDYLNDSKGLNSKFVAKWYKDNHSVKNDPDYRNIVTKLNKFDFSDDDFFYSGYTLFLNNDFKSVPTSDQDKKIIRDYIEFKGWPFNIYTFSTLMKRYMNGDKEFLNEMTGMRR